MKPTLLALSAAIAFPAPALAQYTNYERHTIFDNSRADGWHFFSEAAFTAPSTLEIVNGKVPLETRTVHSAPNALRLQWTSRSGGDWRWAINTTRIWSSVNFAGDALSFWVWSLDELTPGSTPRIALIDHKGFGSASIDLIGKLPRLPARQWVKITLPFSAFAGLYGGTSDARLDPSQLARILIVQGLDDGKPHTLYIDDIRVADAVSHDRIAPPAPAGLSARGYERHIDLSWTPVASPDLESYRIHRSIDGGPFEQVAIQRGAYARYPDFLGGAGKSARYRVTAIDVAGNESPVSTITSASTRAMTDDELLTMVQQAQFRYYWDGAHPDAGLALEVTPGNPDQVALGGSGFGVMALLVGVDRGFVSRAEGIDRMLRIVRFLKRADRFHGVWPHFLDGRTGKTMPVFGKYDNGGDLIETAFMIQGLLAVRRYFDGATAAEREIRDTITTLWREVEWDWYRRTADSDFLYWHWSPDHDFRIGHPLIGWNESLIAYLLAIASPTHAVPASMWHTGWAGTSPTAVAYRQAWSRTTEGDRFVNGNSYYGIRLDVGEGNGAELFFTQFSFLGFDPRGIRDRYTNYFRNNRNIARISQAYAIDNPERHVGYGANAWGQSAGVHSGGGRARPADDNGTLTVHAALGSMPYTPEASMQALRHYYRDLGPRIWGVYGFSDGFNATDNWYDEVYMALNQAQTVVMIENHRTGLLWKLFMANPEIRPALDRIGFVPD